MDGKGDLAKSVRCMVCWGEIKVKQQSKTCLHCGHQAHTEHLTLFSSSYQ
ncbi:MAG: hypothetical protein ACFFBD_13855 [Candidatus Hodarchaeota archaeon]